MFNIKEKKVELIELFYDLIYVYAISRLFLLVEGDGHGEFLPSFIIYVVYCLVILQSWLYLTTYVNRYGKWRWYEIVLTVINMIAALYMSNTIANNTVSPVAFNLSMSIMLLRVLLMYVIEYFKNEEDLGAAKNSIVILIVIEVLYFLAYILSHYPIGPLPIYVDFVAVLLGAFLPFLLKGDFDPQIISFPHLVERLELLTIVTFGDSIVAISQFFDVRTFSLLPSALFIIILLIKFYGWDVTGNDITQEPTWVRIDSLIADYYFNKQVVGHTPLKNPPFISHKNGLELVVVDDEKHKCQYELII